MEEQIQTYLDSCLKHELTASTFKAGAKFVKKHNIDLSTWQDLADEDDIYYVSDKLDDCCTEIMVEFMGTKYSKNLNDII